MGLPSSLRYNLQTDPAQTRVKDGLGSGPKANCSNPDPITPEQPRSPALWFGRKLVKIRIGIKNGRGKETLGL